MKKTRAVQAIGIKASVGDAPSMREALRAVA